MRDAFVPHGALIIVPRTSHVSAFTAKYTVTLVTYYAKGCFRVDQKMSEHGTHNAARRMTWKLAAEMKAARIAVARD